LVVATFAGLAQRPGKSAEVVQGNLSEIATTSKEMLENLRQLTRSLRPQLLDSLGLTRSLQTLLDQTARTDLRVESDLENVDALCPPPGNINLYRIVQEALANVLKHASATKVRASLRADAALVRLSVADDGGGFAVAEPSPRMGREAVSGLGMPGMAERARLLGGSLRVESRPNIQHRTSNTEHPTRNIQHRTSNTEHPTPNIQHRTSNTEQLMITQLPALDVGCSMLGVRCSGPVLNMSRTPGLAACVPLR
jgi:signal transduction histidine kinase